ncbi:hypothetical protein SDC9_210284 [bioreactor metagenome]|uniref:Uncharacterized protein n=1 Tax=bioreactor metagenome TaxID=1076179 RepID=A0A645JFR4_9ZZZZ
MDGAGRGEDHLKAFVQQETQVAQFHLPGRFAKGEDQNVVLDPKGQQPIVKDELDGYQLQGFTFRINCRRILKLELMHLCEGTPGILF